MLLTLGICCLAIADSSKDHQMTIFKTKEGKEIRCFVYPKDQTVLKQLKQGERVQMDGGLTFPNITPSNNPVNFTD